MYWPLYSVIFTIYIWMLSWLCASYEANAQCSLLSLAYVFGTESVTCSGEGSLIVTHVCARGGIQSNSLTVAKKRLTVSCSLVHLLNSVRKSSSCRLHLLNISSAECFILSVLSHFSSCSASTGSQQILWIRGKGAFRRSWKGKMDVREGSSQRGKGSSAHS